MIEWPARCHYCNNTIEDWTEAGLHGKHWLHKKCYTAEWNEAHDHGADLPDMQPPTARMSQLEMPMLISALLFHFGLGIGVIGWIMLDQDQSPSTGVVLLIIGIITPLLGLAGCALNIVSRRRIHTIEQQLTLAGGWKPGR